MYTQGEYLERNARWHVEDSLWKCGQILKMMGRNCIQYRSICEVGCGAGEILNQLHLHLRESVTFAGYEISPQAYELCRKRQKDRLDFYLQDPLEEVDAYFDIVMAIDVLEHVEDYWGFLIRLREKGRYKIFHIPLDLSVQAVLRSFPIVRARESVGHIHYFTKETALAALKDTGYVVIDYFYTAGSIELPARSFRSLLAKLPRKILFRLNRDMTVRVFGGYSLMVLAE